MSGEAGIICEPHMHVVSQNREVEQKIRAI